MKHIRNETLGNRPSKTLTLISQNVVFVNTVLCHTTAEYTRKNIWSLQRKDVSCQFLHTHRETIEMSLANDCSLHGLSPWSESHSNFKKVTEYAMHNVNFELSELFYFTTVWNVAQWIPRNLCSSSLNNALWDKPRKLFQSQHSLAISAVWGTHCFKE